MAQARPPRFAVDQVLRGMQARLNREWDEPTTLEADRPLLDYYDAAVRNDECPLLTLQALAEYFGLDWGETRWIVWLQLRDDRLQTQAERDRAWEIWKSDVAPQLTVRRLAEAIARRAEGVSLEPAVVLGRACGPAGVFRGLCSLHPLRGRHVGPSTPLRSVLAWHQLRSVWERIGWIAGCELPRLRNPDAVGETTRTRLADAAASIALAGAVTAGACLAMAWTPIAAIVVAGVGVIGAMEVRRRLLYRLIDPLPADLQTLGDLARRIATLKE